MALSEPIMEIIKDELTLTVEDTKNKTVYTIPIIPVLKALRDKGYNITKPIVIEEVTFNKSKEPVDWEYPNNKF